MAASAQQTLSPDAPGSSLQDRQPGTVSDSRQVTGGHAPRRTGLAGSKSHHEHLHVSREARFSKKDAIAPAQVMHSKPWGSSSQGTAAKCTSQGLGRLANSSNMEVKPEAAASMKGRKQNPAASSADGRQFMRHASQQMPQQPAASSAMAQELGKLPALQLPDTFRQARAELR